MTDSPLRVLVIGYGPVGARFAENLIPGVRADDIELTVVGAEQSDAYNRVLVAEYAVGAMERGSLTIADRAAVEAAGGRIVTGVSVSELDRTARVAVLSDGRRISYDRVVLATGSRAIAARPPTPLRPRAGRAEPRPGCSRVRLHVRTPRVPGRRQEAPRVAGGSRSRAPCRWRHAS